jgi:hypothetical protein
MPEPVPSWLKRPQQSVPGATLITVLLAVVVVAALYFGREVLVPIALAVLLSFVLAPLVRFLQGWYVPRIVAVFSEPGSLRTCRSLCWLGKRISRAVSRASDVDGREDPHHARSAQGRGARYSPQSALCSTGLSDGRRATVTSTIQKLATAADIVHNIAKEDKNAILSNPALFADLAALVDRLKASGKLSDSPEFFSDTSILLNPKIGNNHGLIHHLTGSLSAGQILRTMGVFAE